MNVEDAPHFDHIVDGDFAFRDDRGFPIIEAVTLVRHLDVTGTCFAAHTPLEHGPVHCTICETPGNRIYMSVPTD